MSCNFFFFPKAEESGVLTLDEFQFAINKSVIAPLHLALPVLMDAVDNCDYKTEYDQEMAFMAINALQGALATWEEAEMKSWTMMRKRPQGKVQAV